MDTGRRQAVLVDKGEGRFEPREVKLGHRGGGYVEIREGLAEGDPVVVSANFLIDAESNLKAALKGFTERSTAMIARLIAWSARNLLLVFFGTGFAAAAGIYALAHLPLDAIPDLSDTQVIVYTEYPGQAPQVIEDQVTYPLTTAMLTRAALEGRARLLVLRRVVRLRDLRGRHRHLLGALARAGIPQRRGLAPARGRDADHRPGCHRRRLGLPVCRDVARS